MWEVKEFPGELLVKNHQTKEFYHVPRRFTIDELPTPEELYQAFVDASMGRRLTDAIMKSYYAPYRSIYTVDKTKERIVFSKYRFYKNNDYREETIENTVRFPGSMLDKKIMKLLRNNNFMKIREVRENREFFDEIHSSIIETYTNNQIKFIVRYIDEYPVLYDYTKEDTTTNIFIWRGWKGLSDLMKNYLDLVEKTSESITVSSNYCEYRRTFSDGTIGIVSRAGEPTKIKVYFPFSTSYIEIERYDLHFIPLVEIVKIMDNTRTFLMTMELV